MLTNSAKNSILNALCGKSSFSVSAYLGLSTTAPDINGGNVAEPSAGGYSRVSLGGSSGAMGTPVEGVIKNDKVIFFPPVKGDWGECKYLCLFDGSAASSRLLMYSDLTTPITPAAGNVVYVDINNFTITVMSDASAAQLRV